MAARVQIVPFRRWHLRRILKLEKRAFPKAPYPRWMFLDLYRTCGDLFFVARRAGRIAGYAVTCVRPGEAEVVSIAVEPEQRGSGIGGALMDHTVAALRRREVRKVTLMVRASNAGAIRFYRRLGFRSRGVVARYYENGEDGIRMSRRV